MSEADIRAERLKKLDLLKAAGMEAYPASTLRDSTCAEFNEQFAELESSGRAVTLGGRIMSLRGQGGIIFTDIFDGTGRVQVVLQRQENMEVVSPYMYGDTTSIHPFDLFQRSVDVGDFIEFTGTAFKTQRGKESLKVASWKMLAKSILPMPAEHFGVKDGELRLRERHLDMLLNSDLRASVERRTKFWAAVRDFYLKRGFLEVETPILETSPGGADARPFITHHNALDIEVYMRIAPELWLKRLLVAGFPKVFEIGRVFRNEGQSREHLQDYTMVESYEAYSDLAKGKEFVMELYRHIAKEVYGKYTFEIHGHTVDLAEEWKTIDFCQFLSDKFGVDPLTCSESDAIRAVHDNKIEVGEKLNEARAIDHLWKSARKGIAGPAFLVGVPVFLEPLAKRFKERPEIVERLQVIMAGSEVGKGFSELNDPQDQLGRFEEQQKLREAGDDEAQRLDESYVRAMEYGMPPAFGFGVSERLFAFLENKSAHECQCFPLLRPKTDTQ